MISFPIKIKNIPSKVGWTDPGQGKAQHCLSEPFAGEVGWARQPILMTGENGIRMAGED
jgi:hypothetical protein